MSRATMRAMVLVQTGSFGDDGGDPPVLELRRLPVPEPGAGEVLVRVHACGVCHTDVDQAEGRIAPPRLPVVPGHQAVGRVAALDELRYHEHLWMEREVKSIANVTGRDIREFLALSPGVPIRPEAAAYPLEQAVRALADLRR